MSINFRQKNANSTFCINDNLINDRICGKRTELVEKKLKNGLDESAIIWLLENCECEKTRVKLNNLLNNHIQKIVAVNEAMKMYLGLNANEATVLGAMYIPTSKSGRGYLSNKMIMHSTGLSKSTIKRSFRKFESLGLIETTYQRDSINKMKVTRNYTFTDEFYGIAKVTGCYTIQTPEKVGPVEPSELHEMSTKPIGTQGSNWTIKNNIYTSITTSNYTKLLVGNINKVNINNEVNSKQEPFQYTSKEKMIVKKGHSRSSYDQIIERFVRKNYKDSTNTIIDQLKKMIQVWYGSYKNRTKKKLKLTNYELREKLSKLLDLSRGNSAIATIILNTSIKNHYSDFYAVNLKTAIAYKDKVINGVIKLCDEHINDSKYSCSPRVYELMDETVYLKELAVSMESTWSRVDHKRPVGAINQGINAHSFVYIKDQFDHLKDIVKTQTNDFTNQCIETDHNNYLIEANNSLINEEQEYIETREPTYNLDLYEEMDPINYKKIVGNKEPVDEIKNQYNPNRLTKKDHLSIEELAVKVDQKDRVFNLDGKVQDTENPAQSVGLRQEKIETIINQCEENLSKKIKTPTPNSVFPLPQSNDNLRAILSPLSEDSDGGGKVAPEDDFERLARKKLAISIISETPEEILKRIRILKDAFDRTRYKYWYLGQPPNWIESLSEWKEADDKLNELNKGLVLKMGRLQLTNEFIAKLSNRFEEAREAICKLRRQAEKRVQIGNKEYKEQLRMYSTTKGNNNLKRGW